MLLVLKRTHKNKFGFCGVLDCDKTGVAWPFISTLENSTLYIPEGKYTCRKAHYNAGGYDTYQIGGVTGRDHLLFHKGNWQKDSLGCILVGMRFDILNGVPAIVESTAAFAKFMLMLEGVEEFQLEIRDCSN